MAMKSSGARPDKLFKNPGEVAHLEQQGTLQETADKRQAEIDAARAKELEDATAVPPIASGPVRASFISSGGTGSPSTFRGRAPVTTTNPIVGRSSRSGPSLLGG